MMERFKYYFNSILVFIFGFLLLGCQPNAKNTENSAMNQQPYLLHFGLQGFKDFAQYNQSGVDNHPVASFRELDFSPPNLGQIKIENGASSLVIDHVDRKSTRLNSSHVRISYAVFCLKKKKKIKII